MRNKKAVNPCTGSPLNYSLPTPIGKTIISFWSLLFKGMSIGDFPHEHLGTTEN